MFFLMGPVPGETLREKITEKRKEKGGGYSEKWNDKATSMSYIFR